MGGADLGATRGRVALDGADNHHGDSECLTMDAMDAMEIMIIGLWLLVSMTYYDYWILLDCDILWHIVTIGLDSLIDW